MRPVVRTQHRGHMFHRRRDLVVGERARLARRAYGKQLSPVDSAGGTYRVRGRELLAYRPGEEPGSGGEDVRHRRARLPGAERARSRISRSSTARQTAARASGRRTSRATVRRSGSVAVRLRLCSSWFETHTRSYVSRPASPLQFISSVLSMAVIRSGTPRARGSTEMKVVKGNDGVGDGRRARSRRLRSDRLTAELADVHAELAAVARASRSERATIRAIAEALGLSRPRVYALLNRPAKPLQADEPIEVGSRCG